MKVYTVLLPPTAGAPDPTDPRSVVVVKEGFSWPAFLFPVLWPLYRGMWLVLIAYLAIMVGLAVAGEFLGGPLPAIAATAAHVFFALEANELRRRGYERKGYRLAGITLGETLEEAEIGYFAGRQTPPEVMSDRLPAEPVHGLTSGAGSAAAASTSDVIGLFPTPTGDLK